MAEGVEDGFEEGVGERDYYYDEDGHVEMISSIVIISEVLRAVCSGKSVFERHYINTIITHVVIFFDEIRTLLRSSRKIKNKKCDKSTKGLFVFC